jgi:hypothetical protein
MRTASMDDEDLIPLSMFSETSFSPLMLSKKRLFISQGELMKLIADYERATSIELVSTVNENYKDSLRVADEIRGIAEKALTTKAPFSADYLKFKKDLERVVSNTSRMQAELDQISQAREDVKLIEMIIDICECVSGGLEHDTLADMEILASEHERAHVVVQATESLQAEGLRQGTSLLKDSLNLIRDELARLKNGFVHKLLHLLDSSCDDIEKVYEIYKALVRLQSAHKFSHFLKSRFLSTLRCPSSANVPQFLENVEREFLDPSSLFSQIVCKVDPKLFEEVLMQCVVAEVSAHGVALFVPTSTNLDEFRANFLACKRFMERFSAHVGFLDKFKASIYFNIKIKRIVDSVPSCTIDQIFQYISNDLFSDDFLIDKSLIPRAFRIMIDILGQIRSVVPDSIDDLLVRACLLLGMVNDHLVHMRETLIRPVGRYVRLELLHRLVDNEVQLFKVSINKMVNKIITEASIPIVQTLESVKQISSLYRVASRGLPSRHSVYVELASKSMSGPLEKFRIVENVEFRSTLISEFSKKCLDTYSGLVTDLLTKERSRSNNSVELEKITCQLYLDMKKLGESLEPTLPMSNLISETRKVYMKNFPNSEE